MDKDKKTTKNGFTELDEHFFEHCLGLAKEALEAGDQPFGSILVDANNKIIAQARNRINEKDVLAHPEIELAKWALHNLSLTTRRETTMYTTGEHCPMCAAAHGWAEIGKLYYLSSAKQLGNWLTEFDAEVAPIQFVPVEKIVKNVIVKGPAEEKLVKRIKEMHKHYYEK